MNVEILIIGTDINAYTMARCVHEKYGKKVNLLGKEELKFTSLSSITNISYEPHLWDTEVFKKVLEDYAKKRKGKKILLIATNDFYVRLIMECETFLKQWYIFNYPKLDIVDTFLRKDLFYQAYCEKLDIPKSYIYSCKERILKTDFLYPVIVKPSNGVTYYKHKFTGQSKVYKIYDEEHLKKVIEQIEDSGYDDTLMIQEFIPGDDSALFDSIFYCDKTGKAILASFAQIALQEHTHTGVGNCTVLVNGYSEYGNYEEQIQKMKTFLEEIGYTGYAEFDLKYDKRDGKYKVLEINPRQARCSYYLTACGYNLIEYLVDDLINNKQKEFTMIQNKVLLSFVPKNIIIKNVENEKLKKEIMKLIKEKKVYNTLNYSKDKSILRKVYLYLRSINYNKKYKEKNWW